MAQYYCGLVNSVRPRLSDPLMLVHGPETVAGYVIPQSLRRIVERSESLSTRQNLLQVHGPRLRTGRTGNHERLRQLMIRLVSTVLQLRNIAQVQPQRYLHCPIAGLMLGRLSQFQARLRGVRLYWQSAI